MISAAYFRAFVACIAVVAIGACGSAVRAEGNGQEDLDEALQLKVTAESLRDLNRVIELLESALDKGLDVESSDFAEKLLSGTLLERASQLAEVARAAPRGAIEDPRLAKVRAMAVSDLRRVLTYDDPPPEATAMLAQLLSSGDGDSREARRLLDRLFEQESFAAMSPHDQAEAYALRASLQQKPERALADYDKAVELAPTNSEFRLARADYHRQRKELDKAREDVKAVIEQQPDEALAYLLDSQILRDQEKLDEALAQAKKAAELAPRQPGPHQAQGEIYREQQKLDEAIAEFSKVLQMQPGAVLALIHRAEAYYAANKMDEALADVEAVLRERPGLAVAHGLRAQILAGKDRLPEAITAMKELAEAMPAETEYRMQLAMYYLASDQPRQAIEAFSEVVEREPKHFLALRSRADSYLNIGDHASAVADFEQAIQINGEDTPLLNNYAWVLATSPDDEVRDGRRAIELATKACELTEYKRPHILSTLAAAYAETGDFETARKWSRKAIELNNEGADKEEGIAEALAKELASYEAEKPWRERQTQEGDKPEESAEKADQADNVPQEPAPSTSAPDPPSQAAKSPPSSR